MVTQITPARLLAAIGWKIDRLDGISVFVEAVPLPLTGWRFSLVLKHEEEQYRIRFRQRVRLPPPVGPIVLLKPTARGVIVNLYLATNQVLSAPLKKDVVKAIFPPKPVRATLDATTTTSIH